MGGGGAGGLFSPFLKIEKSTLILKKKALILAIFELDFLFKV